MTPRPQPDDAGTLRALAEQLRSALVRVPYHRNPDIEPGQPFGYSIHGHREYECPICLALSEADHVLGEFDYPADAEHVAAVRLAAALPKGWRVTTRACGERAVAIGNPAWQAQAEKGDRAVNGWGDTEAAALSHLAARLAADPEPTEAPQP